MTEDFWKRCRQAGCAVVSVEAHSAYNAEGNTDSSTLIGIKYAALQFGDTAVGPDYWFMIDVSSAGQENLFDTPLGALEAFEAKRRAERAGESQK
jgi:hypothetical protein